MTEINSQEYLEMCNQLQDILKKNEDTTKKAEEKLLEYKKFAITTYGVARMISQLMDNSELGIDAEIMILIDSLRSYSSQFTEDNIIRWTEE